MKRITFAFLHLILGYICVCLSFIALGKYPDFADFGLNGILNSHSPVSFFPTSAIFVLRSLMMYFSIEYCQKTKRRFQISLIFSIIFSLIGFFCYLSDLSVFFLSAALVTGSILIFTLPAPDIKNYFTKTDKVSAKKRNNENIKKEKKRKTVKTESPSQSNMQESPDYQDNPIPEMNDKSSKKTPFVIDGKTKKRVLPTLSVPTHTSSVNVNSKPTVSSNTSSGRTKNLQTGDMNKKTNVTISDEESAIDNLKNRVEYIKQFEQRKKIENSSGKPIARLLTKKKEEFIDQDEIINDADEDDDDEYRIEIENDDDSQIVYGDENDYECNDDEEDSGYAGFNNQSGSDKKNYDIPSQMPKHRKSKESKPTEDIDYNMGVGKLQRQDGIIRKWNYVFPSASLLVKHQSKEPPLTDEELAEYEVKLIKALESFQIKGRSDGYVSGPTVTLFRIELALGVKVSRITSVSDDIARFLGLSASGLRIIPTIAGTHDIGIEIPNESRQTVSFIDTLETLKTNNAKLPFALGKSVTGNDEIIDISKTPHLLLAGSTGSGKSVSLNSMIASLLYTRSPENVRFIIVDPKQVELELYNDIPHLLTPVITDPASAIKALDYCVEEMERRYKILAKEHVRNIIGYNDKIKTSNMKREKMPYIVVIIDEFADLMAVVGKELELRVMRIAAKARAVGIHLVLATQRPSVDVITGTLKNNIPTRIAFRVSSAVDSKTILDQGGAEKLLGNGDMLLKGATNPEPTRIQGSFLSDSEVETIINYVKSQDTPDFIQDSCLEETEELSDDEFASDEIDYFERAKSRWSEKDERLLQAAWDLAMDEGGISTSLVQRRLRIGYNSAAMIVDEMARRGIIGPLQGSKKREIIKYKD